jgi:hypothetical protein
MSTRKKKHTHIDRERGKKKKWKKAGDEKYLLTSERTLARHKKNKKQKKRMWRREIVDSVRAHNSQAGSGGGRETEIDRERAKGPWRGKG